MVPPPSQFCVHTLLQGDRDLQISIPAAHQIDHFFLFGGIQQPDLVGQTKQAAHAGGFDMDQLRTGGVAIKNIVKDTGIIQILRYGDG